MRVIAGKYKAKKLDYPKIESVRPTADMVKGALFSTLFDKVVDSTFLDLFCGSGQIGIEALSRGAKNVVFVDNNTTSILTTQKNLAKIEGDYKVVKSDFQKFLKNQKQQFDIIFLDPPYQSGFYEIALQIVFEKSLLSSNGIIVCEHNKNDKMIEKYFSCKMVKNYGIKSLTYITSKENKNL